MELTYSDIVVKHAQLMEIGKLKLPRKVSVAIARNLQSFEKEMEVYNKQREDIAAKWAKKNKDGSPIVKDNAYTFETEQDKAEFIQECAELGDVTVPVDTINFDEEELDKCEDSRYDVPTPIQEVWLSWMENKKE